MNAGLSVGPMAPADWNDVRAVYQEGIETGHATFETVVPSWDQWNTSHHTFARLVARLDGRVVAWAALSPVSGRGCYSGVAEVSVYVATALQRKGIGRRLLEELILESERNGIWTLQSATFPENSASVRLQLAAGFREVGRRARIGRLKGVWRDTILLERRSIVVGSG